MTSAWQKEWDSLLKREAMYLSQGAQKKPSALNNMLADKVPEKLQQTLDVAFAKAFKLIFEKGTDVIEKTYKRDDAERAFKVNSYAVELKEDRKGLRRFSREAGKAVQKNLVLSSVEGIGLGVLGIGLPDIPLFVGMLLKSVYETALHYGYSYDSADEKYFILLLIQTALTYGEELNGGNDEVNHFITNHTLPLGYTQDAQIERTAGVLSTELLYMKFLQGLPIVGAIGGMYNPVYLQRVQKYAKLKYARRMLYDRKAAT